MEKGFNPEEPSFFSMLGVSMYIDIPSQFKIYSEIASLKKVNFVMTHLGTHVSPNMNSITQSVERKGEPFIGKIDDHKLTSMLETVGFTSITKPSTSLIEDWYSQSSLPKPNFKSITISKK
jgi:O-methyltransferase involved in polyketide biosynthesis